jgi:hypothetical protein
MSLMVKIISIVKNWIDQAATNKLAQKTRCSNWLK